MTVRFNKYDDADRISLSLSVEPSNHLLDCNANQPRTGCRREVNDGEISVVFLVQFLTFELCFPERRFGYLSTVGNAILIDTDSLRRVSPPLVHFHADCRTHCVN